MYRQTAPDVYDYNRGSYDPYHPNSSTYPSNQPGSTINTTHQPDPRSTYDNRQTSEQHVTPELRKSHADNRGSRFADYKRRAQEYKYNFFSMIDEPYNRCFEEGKCGTCPGNECIAKRGPKMDWL